MSLPPNRKPLDSDSLAELYSKMLQGDSIKQIHGVNRVELIDESGRQYVNWHCEKIEISFQDGNKTLKIFVKSDAEKNDL